ncbi:MAG: hypothetical protein GF317_03745 [Candidatus Lokiarchaeota archaeon]|nr:hypothetical protein [Candidatus Lokiarchaeota archaeon]MBD3199001.1 hypothetical protein [Candidatus Lokiarchaeota archaeon]
MEKQRDRVKEVSKELKEKTDKELEQLRQELFRLRNIKKQKEQQKAEAKQKQKTEEKIEEAEIEVDEIETTGIEDIENKLDQIDSFLSTQLERVDQKTYEKNAEYIESQLQVLEEEIVGETGLIEEELSPYEKLLDSYPWLEEPRYEFMYSIPNKSKNPNDYESWKSEWGKVLFDYAKYAILHILYLRQLYTEKPFSNFEDRKKAIRNIANELVDQELATWLSKKKDKLRIYWKTLDLWAEEVYEWAYEMGKLEPILIYEIRNANKGFSSLPKEDIEEVFKMLSKEGRAVVIKLEDGQMALKIDIE